MGGGMAAAEAQSPSGETLSVPECMIVSPAAGLFGRLSSDRLRPGDILRRGDVIGVVQSLRVTTPVHSPFEGVLVEILGMEGERVRPGKPLAWLRLPAPFVSSAA